MGFPIEWHGGCVSDGLRGVSMCMLDVVVVVNVFFHFLQERERGGRDMERERESKR